MADEERLLNKLDSLEASIAAHSERSIEFQAEVMDILKGSFEGNEWRPGIAPLLQEQIVRIDTLEKQAEQYFDRKFAWWYGAVFAVFGAITSKLIAAFAFTR